MILSDYNNHIGMALGIVLLFRASYYRFNMVDVAIFIIAVALLFA